MGASRENVPIKLGDTDTVAAFLRVTPSAVRKATKQQALPVALPGRGRKGAEYDLGAVGRWCEQRATRQATSAIDAAGGAQAALDLNQERARLAREQRESARLRNQKVRAEVLDVAVFGHAWDNLATSVRSRLEALALHLKRAQPELSAAALDVIRGEVAAALEDLARLQFDPNADVDVLGDEDAELLEQAAATIPAPAAQSTDHQASA